MPKHYYLKTDNPNIAQADQFWRDQGWTNFPAEVCVDDLSREDLLELIDELTEENKELKEKTRPTLSI